LASASSTFPPRVLWLLWPLTKGAGVQRRAARRWSRASGRRAASIDDVIGLLAPSAPPASAPRQCHVACPVATWPSAARLPRFCRVSAALLTFFFSVPACSFREGLLAAKRTATARTAAAPRAAAGADACYHPRQLWGKSPDRTTESASLNRAPPLPPHLRFAPRRRETRSRPPPRRGPPPIELWRPPGGSLSEHSYADAAARAVHGNVRSRARKPNGAYSRRAGPTTSFFLRQRWLHTTSPLPF